MNATNLFFCRAGLVLVTLAGWPLAGCRSPAGNTRMEKNLAQLTVKAGEGDARAQFELGEIYLIGDCGPRNDEEAFKWLRLAADQGHAGAQHDLGLMYKAGRGTGKDFVEAYKLFNLSAARGHRNAGMRMDSIARLMTREQIIEAQHLAAAFTQQHPVASAKSAGSPETVVNPDRVDRPNRLASPKDVGN